MALEEMQIRILIIYLGSGSIANQIPTSTLWDHELRLKSWVPGVDLNWDGPTPPCVGIPSDIAATSDVDPDLDPDPVF